MFFMEFQVSFIENLQKIDYEYMRYIILLSKHLTKRKVHCFYLLIFLYYSFDIFCKVMIIYYSSRYFVLAVKMLIRQNRPYIDYPERIKWYQKKKYSYSFPSQSIVNLSTIYLSINELCESIYLDFYFLFLFFLIILTRSYRGLHYIHDIIYSIALSFIISKIFRIYDLFSA